MNLVAIEEYEETEAAASIPHYATRRSRSKAKAQLLEVINRINTQTKEMFLTTFTQIRDNFRLMFTGSSAAAAKRT